MATAHGWVSAVWAKTCRPPDARRPHCPATNFHFGFSPPRSYFMDVFSSAFAPNVVATMSSNVAIMSRIGLPPLTKSIQALDDDFPVVAVHQGHFSDGMAVVEAGHRAHSAVSSIGLHRIGGRLGQRASRQIHCGFLRLRCRPIAVVADRLDLEHHTGARVDDDFP